MPISPRPSLYLKNGNCGWSPAAPHGAFGNSLPPINASARSSGKFAKQTSHVWQYSPSAYDESTDKIHNVVTPSPNKERTCAATGTIFRYNS